MQKLASIGLLLLAVVVCHADPVVDFSFATPVPTTVLQAFSLDLSASQLNDFALATVSVTVLESGAVVNVNQNTLGAIAMPAFVIPGVYHIYITFTGVQGGMSRSFTSPTRAVAIGNDLATMHPDCKVTVDNNDVALPPALNPFFALTYPDSQCPGAVQYTPVNIDALVIPGNDLDIPIAAFTLTFDGPQDFTKNTLGFSKAAKLDIILPGVLPNCDNSERTIWRLDTATNAVTNDFFGCVAYAASPIGADLCTLRLNLCSIPASTTFLVTSRPVLPRLVIPFSFNVNDDAMMVHAQFTLSGPLRNFASFHYRTVGATAIPGVHYASGPGTVSLNSPAGEISINILPQPTYFDPVFFELVLEDPVRVEFRDETDSPTATLRIRVTISSSRQPETTTTTTTQAPAPDTSTPPTTEAPASQPCFLLPQDLVLAIDQGPAQLLVNCIAPLNCPAVFQITTDDYTATAAQHYVAFNAQVSMPTGAVTAPFAITLRPDGVITNPPAVFFVNLVVVSGCAVVLQDLSSAPVQLLPAVGGPPVSKCPPPTPCGQCFACDGQLGCVPAPNTRCDDGNPLTTNDTCNDAGQCIGQSGCSEYLIYPKRCQNLPFSESLQPQGCSCIVFSDNGPNRTC